jgi:hypothetical protein
MKFLAALALLAIASCTEKQSVEERDDTAILDDFRAVADAGDFENLAIRIHPEILKTFRRRLEFTTSSPLEGSWFTGTRDRLPTEQEIEALSDTEFFDRFMSGYEPVLGNPFRDAFIGLDVVATTSGTKGYRSFVCTKDTEYAIPSTFTFSEVAGEWVLVSPSFIENFANRLRAARGQTPEG